ncbi:hypothetical protein [Vibrio harveyi]|uniref:hypothetical protein n=1 Tax=Vibrio harveyi TaxID=669 RepID=UPI0023805364|nr:hypothetical protein [Vibrio harveyi]
MINLDVAISILFADLLGLKQEDYANAWLTVAFSDDLEEGCLFNQNTMLDLLASVLSEQTGGTRDVIRSVLHSPMDAKALAARNYIDLKWVLETKLCQWNKEVDNAELALVILASGSESPKFGDSLAYLMETGQDVDPETRAQVLQMFDEAVADSKELSENSDGQIEVKR